jgi:hypothetical protein
MTAGRRGSVLTALMLAEIVQDRINEIPRQPAFAQLPDDPVQLCQFAIPPDHGTSPAASLRIDAIVIIRARPRW